MAVANTTPEIIEQVCQQIRADIQSFPEDPIQLMKVHPLLRVSHKTVQRLVENGFLDVGRDGLIGSRGWITKVALLSYGSTPAKVERAARSPRWS